MLTKGDLQTDELSRLRSQFEAYVKQHYDVQELSSRYEREIRSNQAKISELLQTITQLQDKLKEFRVTLKQKNEYITALEKNNEAKLKIQNQLSRDLEHLKQENMDLSARMERGA